MQPVQAILLYPDRHATEVKEYQFSELTLADIETINLAIRAKTVRAARLSLDDCTNEFQFREVLDSANRVIGEISLISGVHAKYFGTLEGQATIFHVMLRKYLKDFTLEQAYKIVCDPRNDSETTWAFEVMKGFTAPEIVKMRADAAKKKEKDGAKSEPGNPTTLPESLPDYVGSST